jgi:hypothetical protein
MISPASVLAIVTKKLDHFKIDNISLAFVKRFSFCDAICLIGEYDVSG